MVEADETRWGRRRDGAGMNGKDMSPTNMGGRGSDRNLLTFRRLESCSLVLSLSTWQHLISQGIHYRIIHYFAPCDFL